MTVPSAWEEGTCAECGRGLLEDGPARRIEAAWDRDGQHPVLDFLRKLKNGTLSRARKEHLFDLLIRYEDYCTTGTLSIPGELNHLADDIWEIKAQNLRTPFFPSNPDQPFTLRATHGFVKGTRKTPLKEIDKAKAIRQEDHKR